MGVPLFIGFPLPDGGFIDSGVPDAGSLAVDAGKADAGTPSSPDDAGSTDDAGAVETRGASDGGDPAQMSLIVGCGCAQAPLGSLVLWALALLLRRATKPR